MAILITIAAVSFLAAAGMLAWQLSRLRRGLIEGVSGGSLSAMIEPKVDHLAFQISAYVSHFGKHLSLQLLLFAKKVLTFLKYAIIKIEKRFIRVIDLLRAKGSGKSSRAKSAVSRFVQEVEQYTVEVKSLNDEKKEE